MSNLPMHVALVSEIDQAKLSFSELSTVSSAISRQVARDFGPIWGINATVDPFPSLQEVPAGYWPVTIKDDIGDPGAAGYHSDDNGNPFSLVQYGPGWSLTASHEVLEMLADPFGNRVVASVSPADNATRVEILVEVCDPAEDTSFSYPINGVTVSDFYTPQYLEAVSTPGVRYSFTDALREARQVLTGGYLSFHDLTDGQWKQWSFFDGDAPKLTVIGSLSAAKGRSIRSQVDQFVAKKKAALLAKSKALSDKRQEHLNAAYATMAAMRKEAATSSNTKATMWRAQIERIAGSKKPTARKKK